jgi:hypothetical protein
MSNTAWLSDEEARAWRAYIDLSTLLGDYLDQQLRRDSDISHTTYHLLSLLAAQDDFLRRAGRGGGRGALRGVSERRVRTGHRDERTGRRTESERPSADVHDPIRPSVPCLNFHTSAA